MTKDYTSPHLTVVVRGAMYHTRVATLKDVSEPECLEHEKSAQYAL